MIKEMKEFIDAYKYACTIKEDIKDLENKKSRLQNCTFIKEDFDLNTTSIILNFKIETYNNHKKCVNRCNKLLYKNSLFIFLISCLLLSFNFFTFLGINIIFQLLNYKIYLNNTKVDKAFLNKNNISDLIKEKDECIRKLEENKLIKKNINKKIKKYDENIKYKSKQLNSANNKMNSIIKDILDVSLINGIDEKMEDNYIPKTLVKCKNIVKLSI